MAIESKIRKRREVLPLKAANSCVAVGGTVVPVDKFSLLAPYIAVGAIVIGLTIAVIYARRKGEKGQYNALKRLLLQIFDKLSRAGIRIF